MVAPTTVFLSDRSPFGTFLVSNKSAAPQEVTISFRFGYPASDSAGNVFMNYKDSLAEQKYSITQWLKAFPQKFVLQPLEEQTIRFLIHPPSGIEDGLYWTRLVTSTRPVSAPVETVSTGITAQITFVIEQVTTIVYKKGKVYTNLSVGNPQVSQDSSALHITVPVERSGNSPFFGTIVLRLYDPNTKRYLRESTESSAIYFNCVKRFSIPLSELRAGKYDAELTFSSGRIDLPQEEIPQIAPITKRFSFEVR